MPYLSPGLIAVARATGSIPRRHTRHRIRGVEVVWMDGWPNRAISLPEPTSQRSRSPFPGLHFQQGHSAFLCPIEMLIRPETKRHTSRPPKSQLADLWGTAQAGDAPGDPGLQHGAGRAQVTPQRVPQGSDAQGSPAGPPLPPQPRTTWQRRGAPSSVLGCAAGSQP